MEIQQIPVGKIKPDPNQPRKFIDQNRVREMSVSIKNEGVINPIEVDDKLFIITGEIRWRAAKRAGLKTVPVKILTGEKSMGMDRYIRQVQENIHHNTMSALDTAKALKRVQQWILKNKPLVRSKNHSGERYQQATKEIRELLGITNSNISAHIKLLEEPVELQRILAKRDDISVNHLQKIRGAPLAYQYTLKKKLLAERLPMSGLAYLIRRIKELDKAGNYAYANELLKKNYAGMQGDQIIAEVNRTSAGVKYLQDDQAAAQRLRELMDEVSKLAKQRPLHTFQPLFRVSLGAGTTFFLGELLEWLEDKSKVRQLLEKNDNKEINAK